MNRLRMFGGLLIAGGLLAGCDTTGAAPTPNPGSATSAPGQATTAPVIDPGLSTTAPITNVTYPTPETPANQPAAPGYPVPTP